MKFPTALPGCFELRPRVMEDARGRFFKYYVQPEFAALGLRTDFVEEYCSFSRRGVIRGMHFQEPPHQHAKLVFCATGSVRDVVVDLRVGSPTYHQVMEVVLSAEQGNMLYIPEGMAHGFQALEDALMVYKVTSVYHPESDRGVLWSSLPIDWQTAAPPVLSDRDQKFPALQDYQSPFRYEETP
ncbi:dTDP-4-dehydrorhamnose 3,5-epimerase [Deinococcus cellulosilyticus]|uniref:dTDP-4-dehydrorhamnose 3,5-epimerase n=1 Tax=Deinococcus cellulosilyticus (strain DSM 18568 / NBRC 106333 / KACC 11606 / 5516J-15) TaxID=1223518 RepID=A0A511MXF3_DEIC1|nr:dTDP-4-dehydrorhamnose 3,5-epimerase [Deinococcus cellulosilyticus]GEM45263.1 dTDP-4-dehydrorhamnose 3,5-epimerase [Deinococcus cellulosilyticus NBRC 106333 = KACC 11606]